MSSYQPYKVKVSLPITNRPIHQLSSFYTHSLSQCRRSLFWFLHFNVNEKGCLGWSITFVTSRIEFNSILSFFMTLFTFRLSWKNEMNGPLGEILWRTAHARPCSLSGCVWVCNCINNAFTLCNPFIAQFQSFVHESLTEKNLLKMLKISSDKYLRR